MPSVFATSVAPAGRGLRRRPDLELAVLELRRAVLRLERRVRDERIVVGGLDRLRRAGRAPRRRRRPCASLLPAAASTARPPVLANAALLCAAVGPSSHVTFSCFARRLRLPPACRRRWRRPASDPVQVRRAFDDERVLHARQRLDLVEVRASRPCRRTPGTSRRRRSSMPGTVTSMPKIGLPVTIGGSSTPRIGLPMIL